MPYRSISVMAAILSVAAAWPGLAQERPAGPPVAAVVDKLAGGLVERGGCVGCRGRHRPWRHAGLLRLWRSRARQRPPAASQTPSSRSVPSPRSSPPRCSRSMAHRHVVKLDAPLQSYVPRGITVPGFAGRQITLVGARDPHLGLAAPAAGRAPTATRRPRCSRSSAHIVCLALRAASSSIRTSAWRCSPMRSQRPPTRPGRRWSNATSRPSSACPTRGSSSTASSVARLATGYNRVRARARENLSTWPAFNGAGALFSTVNDLMRFLAWNEGVVAQRSRRSAR